MTNPTVAAKNPIAVELEADQTYWFCSCGRAASQPFCDGSHKGSEFRPQEFRVDESKSYWLCQCKGTKSAPYCDGTHKCLNSK